MSKTQTVSSSSIMKKIERAKALVSEGKVFRYQTEEGKMNEWRVFSQQHERFTKEPYVVTTKSCNCIDFMVIHAMEDGYFCKHRIAVALFEGQMGVAA